MNSRKEQISLLIKPVSSLCNMRCHYCFYHDVAENREIPSYGTMDWDTAETLIFRVFEYAEPETFLHFAFQGGEPTLAGLEFFQRFVQQVEAGKSKQQKVAYSIQTNGLLLDDDWCAFLASQGFLVGLSLDGSGDCHDLHRLDTAGKGTYSRVVQTAKRMDKYKVEYNILSVVTRAIARKPEKVFKEYLKNRYSYIQFIPCLTPLGENSENKYDITPAQYADFLIVTFRQWKHQLEVGNYISIRLFDNLVGLLKGYPAEQCGILGNCTWQRVVEADGSVYPCDFYVLDPYRCGNIHKMTLEEIDLSENAHDFLKDKEAPFADCVHCRVWKLCKGGCKRYRGFYHSVPGYCPYQTFLYEIFDELTEVARKLK